MKFKIVVTSPERTQIIAALYAYGLSELAARIYRESHDLADDGAEVAILSVDRESGGC
jgi:hypothetical protein